MAQVGEGFACGGEVGLAVFGVGVGCPCIAEYSGGAGEFCLAEGVFDDGACGV